MKSRSHCKAAVHPTHSGQPNTHGCGSISLSLPWQGVIDHRPMWDLEMKTAGVFTGGECRVTERWACWWNRQADRGTESEPLLTHAPFMTRETQLKRPRLWMQQLLWLASRPPACPEWLLEPSPVFFLKMIFNRELLYFLFGHLLVMLARNSRKKEKKRCKKKKKGPFFYQHDQPLEDISVDQLQPRQMNLGISDAEDVAKFKIYSLNLPGIPHQWLHPPTGVLSLLQWKFNENSDRIVKRANNRVQRKPNSFCISRNILCASCQTFTESL